MPTYEYACKACGEHLEVAQSFDDEPLERCPACGGRLRKVFGSIGIAFKGSGFYRNDSRAPSRSGSGTDGSKEAKEPAGAKAGAADSSPGSESKGGESKGGESKASESKGGGEKGSERNGPKAGASGSKAAAS